MFCSVSERLQETEESLARLRTEKSNEVEELELELDEVKKSEARWVGDFQFLVLVENSLFGLWRRTESCYKSQAARTQPVCWRICGLKTFQYKCSKAMVGNLRFGIKSEALFHKKTPLQCRFPIWILSQKRINGSQEQGERSSVSHFSGDAVHDAKNFQTCDRANSMNALCERSAGRQSAGENQ